MPWSVRVPAYKQISAQVTGHHRKVDRRQRPPKHAHIYIHCVHCIRTELIEFSLGFTRLYDVDLLTLQKRCPNDNKDGASKLIRF